ncbi:MAG: alpha-galactosidase [Lachnospiraceae bacterium]|nr:alpha-galactosidase [Lachnospiraceae bacterium]
MIEIKESESGRPLFVLSSRNITYACKVLDNGQLEHLYFGPRISVISSDGLSETHEFPPGNSSVYSRECSSFSPEDMRYEYSAPGKGDVREPMIEAVYADGSSTLDLVYRSHVISRGKPKLDGLPSSYAAQEDVESLVISLKDNNGGLELVLIYSIFPRADIITRSACLRNRGTDIVKIGRIMSMQLDLDPGSWEFHSFTGAWAREMRKNVTPLGGGRISIGSLTGSSSNRANPFFMISEEGATEDAGLVYGFNLVYSGNHYASAETSAYGKLRVMNGIQPDGFSWTLKSGESFQTPEAVLAVSDGGFDMLSRRLHRFVREHIVRGEWKHRERPVLLNSWEACYFGISESRLYRLARVAKSAGIELFVMDDGWFGERNDDTSSLGDWTVNKKKLPHGIKGIADKVRALGMQFGIWVEPEMVSENSALYRSHPEWAMRIPGKDHSEGRNQMILDLASEEVREYIVEEMSRVFSSADISYVKWDMNRNFTDVYSPSLPEDRQGETAHRYILGLYDIMDRLTKKFPDILFEGCASGGNRFDLGILSYFPQIWASDDTDALCRAQIQEGYSYGYPMSCLTSHVSDVPNHQTLRRTPLETRFNVATAGILGYECNLADMTAEELDAVKEQVKVYKQWRKVLQFGDYHRVRGFFRKNYADALVTPEGKDIEWTVVSRDGMKAVSVVMQILVKPNTQYLCLKPKGLRLAGVYRVYTRTLKNNLKDFGSLVNAVAPVHVKQDGVVHNILSKFVRPETEKEEHLMTGSALMHAGLRLKSAFAGVGYDENVRFYPDFASRLFFIEAEGEPLPALPMKGEEENKEKKDTTINNEGE